MNIDCIRIIVATVAFCFAATAAAETDHRIEFVASDPSYDTAAAEYRQIWAEDGDRVVETMERYTGLPFEPGPIHTIVYEGISFSGYKDERPMRMRASYPEDTKRATLVHELSHRIMVDIVPADFEDHPYIFLFLYDVWVELWGEAFADAQVAVESRRRGVFDYEGAWNTALSLSADERAAAWREFVNGRSGQVQ